MKLQLTKMLALLLAGLMTLSATSCARGDHPDNTDETEDTSSTAAVTEDETGYKPDIEVTDYNSEFVVAGVHNIMTWILPKEDSTGDPLQDSIHERNIKIKDHLGVTIQTADAGDWRNYASTVLRTVRAGEDAYQMVASHCYMGVPSLMTSNAVCDFAELDSVNLDAPYWSRDFMDSLTVQGKYLVGYNDMCMAEAFCWAFNKDLMAVYNLTAPYADVTNNVWTLDKLMSLASNVVADNGDNVWGPEDTYGMIGRGWEEVISMASACDLRFVDRDENDVYTIALENNSEKTLKAIQMLCDMYNGQYAYFAPPEEVARVPRAGKSFADGTALFTTTSSNISGFRNLEFPFGVVPMPKFDEAQKEYRSLNWNGMMFVPVSVQNKDMVSDTLEMLAYYTAPVKTAYLEDLLGTKLADAPEDAEMLDIIWNSVVSDVGLIMAENKNINTILHLVPTLCIEGSINRFGSTMQQNTKAANKALSQMLDTASRN